MINLTNIKAILLDLDGVLNITENDAEYIWQKTREKDLGISHDILNAFWKTKWKPVVLGNKDFKTELFVYLEKHNLEHKTTTVIDYFIEKNTNIDDRVLNIIKNIDLPIYMASDLDKSRLDHYWNKLNFKDVFAGKFISSEMGVKKSKAEFFEKAQKEIGLPAGDVLFIDDDPKNVEEAEKLGIRGYSYKNFENTYNDIFNHLMKEK